MQLLVDPLSRIRTQSGCTAVSLGPRTIARKVSRPGTASFQLQLNLDLGMVFAVNPGPEGSANSFSAFREKAKSTGMVMNPSPVVDNGPPTLMPVPVMPGPGDDVTSGTTYTGSGYAYSD